jgi:hypothetical protein
MCAYSVYAPLRRDITYEELRARRIRSQCAPDESFFDHVVDTKGGKELPLLPAPLAKCYYNATMALGRVVNWGWVGFNTIDGTVRCWR